MTEDTNTSYVTIYIIGKTINNTESISNNFEMF